MALAWLCMALTVVASEVQTPPTAPQAVVGERVRVEFWDGNRARAQALLDQLDALPPLLALPPGLPRGVQLRLAETEERFLSLTGGAPPDWSAAVALPDQDVIVLPVYASNRTRGGARAVTLRHEWAHLGLEQHLRGLRIPRWFHEGYALHAAREWDARAGWKLRWALATGAAPPLDSLSLDWPAGAARAGLAYDLAATAVEYLLEPAGEEGLRIFLERWRSDGSFDEALAQVFGFTPGRFESAWLRWVKRRYGWGLVLSQSVLLWLSLGAVLLLLWRWRARRLRDRMARLRAAEPPDAPAWWDVAAATEAPAPPPDPNPGGEAG
ncbi:MAG: peptidase MA family metallohydrolase [Gemmatimonadota bacterium]